MKRVIIADNQDLCRHGLRDMLRSQLDEAAISEARNASETIALVKDSAWDLLILDLNLPGGGLTVLEAIAQAPHQPKVLAMTAQPEHTLALQALQKGAAGYATKREGTTELAKAVNLVLEGSRYVSTSLAERHLTNAPQKAVHAILSERELQVLRGVALGKSIKEIAAELSLSERTIATYRTRLAIKTGLKSNVEIARYALKEGLVD